MNRDTQDKNGDVHYCPWIGVHKTTMSIIRGADAETHMCPKRGIMCFSFMCPQIGIHRIRMVMFIRVRWLGWTDMNAYSPFGESLTCSQNTDWNGDVHYCPWIGVHRIRMVMSILVRWLGWTDMNEHSPFAESLTLIMLSNRYAHSYI